nr:YraN family protein [Desulfobulbaceae bacterium]
MPVTNKQLGMHGEELAARYLEKKGYCIKEMNFRVRAGEVDVIALDHDVLVFVEVKTRTGLCYGVPAEAVTYKKQQQISKAALAYINQYELHDCDARFDVLSVMIKANEKPQFDLIKNAFDLSYD